MIKNKYLWKYMSIDKFESLLCNEGLYFSTFAQLRDSLDPYEGQLLKLYTEKLIKEKEETINECKQINSGETKDRAATILMQVTNDQINNIKTIEKNFFYNTFICSFNADNIENYALWKIYPTNLKGEQQINQGVAIRIKEEFFLDIINEPCFELENNILLKNKRVILKNTQYIPHSEFINISENEKFCSNCSSFYSNIHFTKSDHYKYENEKRAIIQMFNENKNYDRGGFLKINIEKFFCDNENVSLFISPFASDNFRNYVCFLLDKYNVNAEEIVYKSDVAICK